MFTEILSILIDFGLRFLTLALLLRFVFQAVRADFYNPISQAIVKITNPILRPMRMIIPGLGGLDISSLLAALLTLALHVTLLTLLGGGAIGAESILPIFAYASVQLLQWILNIFMFALLIMVILSWVAPFSNHPGALLVRQITEPMLAPIRRVIPPVGGLDFSVMVALLVIYILQSVVLPRMLAGV